MCWTVVKVVSGAKLSPLLHWIRLRSCSARAHPTLLRHSSRTRVGTPRLHPFHSGLPLFLTGPAAKRVFTIYSMNENTPPRCSSPSPSPPPYPKDEPSSSRSQGQGGDPSFWTGVAAGGIGSYLYNRATQPRQQPQSATYDWERPGTARSSGWFGQPQPRPSPGSTSRYNDDRSERSSNLGSMRTSTGFGGSHVR